MNTHNVSKQLTEIQEYVQKSVCEQKEILNLTEAASFLSISKSTLYKMTHMRSIPFYKPSGKLIFFKRKDLVDWVEGIDQSSSSKSKLV